MCECVCASVYLYSRKSLQWWHITYSSIQKLCSGINYQFHWSRKILHILWSTLSWTVSPPYCMSQAWHCRTGFYVSRHLSVRSSSVVSTSELQVFADEQFLLVMLQLPLVVLLMNNVHSCFGLLKAVMVMMLIVVTWLCWRLQRIRKSRWQRQRGTFL